MNPLDTYSRAAQRSAGEIIGVYSTSFGWACRTLPADTRRAIASIYALVRVADETVDGAGAGAGLGPAGVRAELDRLEQETENALTTGYSTNLVVHAFARTARRHAIGPDLTRPFFASMRADITGQPGAASELDEYIHGSAEVVGLMCLRVFLSLPGTARQRTAELEAGARRLGAAFQKVNFLRDLSADQQDLGRVYLPGTAAGDFTDEVKDAALEDIRADLSAASETLPLLDPGARRAVGLAHALFSALVDRLEAAPAATIARQRLRVGTAQKLLIAVRVFAAAARDRSRA
ncbi:phytoene/squalene synthase family protein [Zhihengliuella halotolerans]|uniref:Phytoene/squalene synthetase n=1 Tax=Zhihengliuella halotolerans TaxID=370736 RepID=A0A4Q8AGV7_9MICC|nr:squalene/phytoene synthase family protein [Zhihengliuella halotolerans]RZU62995.1 phytoene/squalene synthetase [Zhihengliuella halotolerans]